MIALSLLLLYPAELLLISRFGWVLAALLGVAWLSSVVLLPALLAGPLGRLIEDVELRSRKLEANGEQHVLTEPCSHAPKDGPPTKRRLREAPDHD